MKTRLAKEAIVEPVSFVFEIHERIEPKGGGYRLQVRRLTYVGEGPIVHRIIPEMRRLNKTRHDLSTEVARTNVCKQFNDREFERAMEARSTFRERHAKDRNLYTSRMLVYHETVYGRFQKWYWEHNEVHPTDKWKKDSPNQTKSPSSQIKIAASKYTEKHFRAVDRLSKKTKQAAAIDEVVKEYGFTSREGFEKQYRRRWLNKKKRGTEIK